MSQEKRERGLQPFRFAQLSPSPDAIFRRQAGVSLSGDAQRVHDHFAAAVSIHSTWCLARFGNASPYHIDELRSAVLDWLATDDFARYEPIRNGCARPFRYFLKGTIENMAQALQRALVQGPLPARIKSRFGRYWQKLQQEKTAHRLTPELTPDQADALNREILGTYLNTHITDQEMVVVEALKQLSSRSDFDPHAPGLNRQIAQLTGKKEGSVRQIRCRFGRKLAAYRARLVSSTLE